MPRMVIRDFRSDDGSALDHVAGRAFAEYSCHFENWPRYHEEWSRMSALANLGRIAVAECDGEIVGGVCYIGPDGPRPEWFENEWAIMRSLVVDPDHRNRGIGRKLAEACIALAQTDNCGTLALQSAPIMTAAVHMYQNMGFMRTRALGAKDGVDWYLYCLHLTCET